MPLHGRHVLLFHQPAGERAQAQVEKILERLGAADAAASRGLLKQVKDGLRFGVEELFLGQGNGGNC